VTNNNQYESKPELVPSYNIDTPIVTQPPQFTLDRLSVATGSNAVVNNFNPKPEVSKTVDSNRQGKSGSEDRVYANVQSNNIEMKSPKGNSGNETRSSNNLNLTNKMLQNINFADSISRESQVKSPLENKKQKLIVEKKAVAKQSQFIDPNQLQNPPDFPVPQAYKDSNEQTTKPPPALVITNKLSLNELESKINKLTVSKATKKSDVESDSQIVRNIKSLFPQENERIMMDPSNIWPLLLFIAGCIFT